MILVDTSVWIDHPRKHNPILAELLEQNPVLMHPMVLGEMALGNLQNRRQLLHLWQGLETLRGVDHKEAMYFIELHALAGKGIGYVDIHLLASIVLVAGVRLWTLNKRLAAVAMELPCAWQRVVVR